MGYFVNPRVKTWGRNARIIGNIEWGDSQVEPIERDEALRLLEHWGAAPDDYDA